MPCRIALVPLDRKAIAVRLSRSLILAEKRADRLGELHDAAIVWWRRFGTRYERLVKIERLYYRADDRARGLRYAVKFGKSPSAH